MLCLMLGMVLGLMLGMCLEMALGMGLKVGLRLGLGVAVLDEGLLGKLLRVGLATRRNGRLLLHGGSNVRSDLGSPAQESLPLSNQCGLLRLLGLNCR